MGIQNSIEYFNDENSGEGFALLSRAGFSCADFSLNGYLLNTDIYQADINRFCDASVSGLERFFTPHKNGAKAAGMHMPYLIYVRQGSGK